MTLADARAIVPALQVAEADPAADAAMLAAIADWCRRWTPLSAIDAPDGVMLDITGCAHLFGGEGALLRDARDRFAAQGWRTRAAISSTPACAWAWARYRERQGPHSSAHGSSAILQRGEEERALRDLPVAALKIAPAVAEALVRMGLRRIGDLVERPRAPLAARFGDGLLRRLDETIGRIVAPIAPREAHAPYLVERRFFEPIATEDDVLRTVEALARQLGERLARHGEGARRVELSLFRLDGAVRHVSVGLGRPGRDAKAVTSLFRERLAALADPVDPGFGFDVVRLAALAVDPQTPVQASLDGEGGAGDLLDLLDRLGARLGIRRVQGFAQEDTHVPEFSVSALPAAMRSPRCAPEPAPANTLVAERPLRLFATAERIETVSPVPDGPPLQFRWRRALHLVRKAEGPERIAPEWWKSLGAPAEERRVADPLPRNAEESRDTAALPGPHPEVPAEQASRKPVLSLSQGATATVHALYDHPSRRPSCRTAPQDEGPVGAPLPPPPLPGPPRDTLTRDYFRVEDSEGRRFWLYREGLYGEAALGGAHPRWFLHGLFA